MGVFLRHARASTVTVFVALVCLHAVCLYIGYQVCFSVAECSFFADYFLSPDALTSANRATVVKKTVVKRMTPTKKVALFKINRPLVRINTDLLLLDSYTLAPCDWYALSSYEQTRQITVTDPYALTAHEWCTLYFFVNSLPEWLYDNYTIVWHDETYIEAYKKHGIHTLVLIMKADTLRDQRMRQVLECKTTELHQAHLAKNKQRKKTATAHTALNTTWRLDARYTNRLLVRSVEGKGVP